ncbi:carbon-nitrogen hydrolase family protein [Caenimonas terrae]|uniref:Carbon-nitrogen hydrolase family protein n=1 Tax=Caenimonas terrae TaxID=696074 RepID=A0ABW0NHK2_9BURK
MSLPRSSLRIAIAQIPMHWTIEENLAAMLSAMRLARSAGATLCAFSELAVTGFHRKIVELAKADLVAPAIRQITDAASELRLAVAFGAPTFGPDDAKYNSHILVDELGEVVAEVHKNGLTAPEATFFQPGTSRPAAPLRGFVTSAVICREVEDHGPVVEQLRESAVRLVLWPGLMSPDPDKPVTDPPEHVVQAQRIAAVTGAYVVQSNWPNALNNPERSVETGHSVCISPLGVLLIRLPQSQFGVGVFNLGESAFDWHAQ